jgi:hypothetical protein
MVTSEQIVSEFGDFIEKNSTSDIRDVSELPYTKNIILNAIFSLIEKEQNKELLNFLKEGVYFLAYFQEGVGSTPLNILGVDYSTPPTNDEELMRLAEKISNNPNQDKFEFFNNLVQKDIQNIRVRLNEILSSKLAQQIESQKAPPAFADIKVSSHWKYFGNIFVAVLILMAVMVAILKIKLGVYEVGFLSLIISLLITQIIGSYSLRKSK